jgi:two-component system response regulator AtoC
MEKKTILLVDDDSILRNIIKEVLLRNYDVLEASSCSEAQEQLSRHFDLALVDYALPDCDGFEVLKMIRSAKSTIPLILMTGYSTEDLAIKALRAGITDFIKKPIRYPYLLSKLSEVLGGEEREKPYETVKGHGEEHIESLEERVRISVLLAMKNPSNDIASLCRTDNVDVLPQKDLLLEFVAKKSYDVIMLEDNVDMIPSIKSVDPRAEVILFTQVKGDDIEILKLGASAYFSMPVDIEKLRGELTRIRNLVEKRREIDELENILIDKYVFHGVVGKNPRMLEIYSFITRIAPYFRAVNITGETGSGKEVVARALHAQCHAAKSPFLVCNCGGLVENLIESELFGHKKGSFTGAITDKIGLFEAVGEGTLLLDEIGELPLSFQPHLLRVLENGEFRRIGSNQISSARCRIIAATNEDLEEKVREGKFREDLFFRLARLTIKIPPLRERKDDILLLSKHLLNRFNQRTGKKVLGISRPAQSVLMNYHWKGNVRELENVIEEAAILATETFIKLQDLPLYIRESSEHESPVLADLGEVEKSHIEAVLKQCNQNRTKSAQLLGISRRSLLRKIEKFKIK